MQRSKNWTRENIRDLARDQNMSLKELAAACGFDHAGYKWLRRIASTGLVHVQKSGQQRLNRIAEFISRRYLGSMNSGHPECLQPVDILQRLVADDLLLFLQRFQEPRRVLKSLRPVVESRGPLCSDTEAEKMLRHLLETRRFDYLKMMLADVHRSYFG